LMLLELNTMFDALMMTISIQTREECRNDGIQRSFKDAH
jgi:hypothetical protein